MSRFRTSRLVAWPASLLWAALVLTPAGAAREAQALVAEASAPANSGATVVLEVNGEPITQAEFEQEALLHRAEIANEQVAAAKVARASGEADAGGDDAVPAARLHEVTKAVLVRLAVERALFREYGVAFPADYAALVAACERENQRRAEAVARHQVIFGPKRFSVLAWRDYLQSNARIELQRRLGAARKLVVPEEELAARFRALRADGTIRAEATLDECRAGLAANLVEEHYRRLLDERVRVAAVREIAAQ